MKNSAFTIIIILLFSCKSSENVNSKNDNIFKYNASNGKCMNDKNIEGLNILNLKKVHQNKNCECTDLSDIPLVELLPNIPESQKFSYNIIKGYNFRGAFLSKSTLNFNYIEDGDFSGANMEHFSYGYAGITGTVDQFTILPKKGCEEVVNHQLECFR